MNLSITTRHLELKSDITEQDVKDHAERRILPLKRFFDKVMDAELVLNTEKHRHKAELTFHIVGGPVTASCESKDILESIDTVSDKIERQLKKRTDQWKIHKGNTHKMKIDDHEKEDF